MQFFSFQFFYFDSGSVRDFSNTSHLLNFPLMSRKLGPVVGSNQQCSYIGTPLLENVGLSVLSVCSC